ncbi:hypothetical protein EVAR_38141_1 [Eumeta japonica]|uniref:Uncharacterized protein n=1 Tax=Eumeta variegata TaxID=151549 RepID=A0A4C1YQQ4_EUMVA|nr:hypothetical protein EVAR_38141_1 [Eumeta japonica]
MLIPCTKVTAPPAIGLRHATTAKLASYRRGDIDASEEATYLVYQDLYPKNKVQSRFGANTYNFVHLLDLRALKPI